VRIGLAVVLIVSLFITPHAVEARKPEKVWRVGYLAPVTALRVRRNAGDASVYGTSKR
jgi:hypothetical protein